MNQENKCSICEREFRYKLEEFNHGYDENGKRQSIKICQQCIDEFDADDIALEKNINTE